MNKRRALMMLTGGIALASTAAVGAYLVAAAIGFLDEEGGESLAQGSETEAAATPTGDSGGSGSRPTVRDGLYFCVDAVDEFLPAETISSIEEAAEANVRAALSEVARHQYWDKVDLGVRDGPLVFEGCPAAPLPMTTQDGKWIGGDYVGFPPSVTTPSPFRVFVFILPGGEIQNLLNSSTKRVIPQEFQCEHPCFRVTVGVYVTPEEASTEIARLAQLIEVSLGLRRQSDLEALEGDGTEVETIP